VKGKDGGGGLAGADGRFAFELPAGDYTVKTTAEGYAISETKVSVGASGIGDLRIELGRGLPLEGKVLDVAGRPASRVSLVARHGEERDPVGFAATKDDGSFRFESLPSRAYTIAGQTLGDGAFTFRSGITPGDRDVVLTLRPGGRIRLTAVDVKGAPLAEAWPSLTAVDGTRVGFVVGLGRTDAQGTLEFPAPAGLVELKVTAQGQEGKATVEVATGLTAPVRVVLGPAAGP
jgi:hypothetical protein